MAFLIIAKYNSRCCKCLLPITKGIEICFIPGGEDRGSYHRWCVPKPKGIDPNDNWRDNFDFPIGRDFYRAQCVLHGEQDPGAEPISATFYNEQGYPRTLTMSLGEQSYWLSRKMKHEE